MSFYLYKTELNESASWVSAENLWILGRYMVHLPLEEIMKISLTEVSSRMSFECISFPVMQFAARMITVQAKKMKMSVSNSN